MGTGMPRVVVLDLVLHDSTRTLFAATYGRSMYTYDLRQLEAIDSDGDGVADTADCAPADPGAFAVPGEVSGQLFAGDKETQQWTAAAAAAGTGTVYDLVRGALGELPVGSGATESCVAYGFARAKASDEAVPSEGTGFWYLARARNTCGPGPYGFSSSGSQRTSASCP
jgi:hypothetical protein